MLKILFHNNSTEKELLQPWEPGHWTCQRLGLGSLTGRRGEDSPFRPQELGDCGLDALLLRMRRLAALLGLQALLEVEGRPRHATVQARDEPLGAARNATEGGNVKVTKRDRNFNIFLGCLFLVV